MVDLVKLGKVGQEIREKAGLSRMQFALTIDPIVDPQLVYRFERGKSPSIYILHAYAKLDRKILDVFVEG